MGTEWLELRERGEEFLGQVVINISLFETGLVAHHCLDLGAA
jgi:hypothetical protein